MSRFSGKTVLITGGTSGIGLATAKRIVAEGGSVIVTGHGEKHIAEAKEALPEGTPIFKNDAAHPDEADALAKRVEEYAGSIHGVFLNAGSADFVPIEKNDADAFDFMFHLNVRGPILQMAALKPLISDHGSVVLTSSIAAFAGPAAASIYAATKGAVTAFSKSLAKDLSDRRIRVNTVAPGPIETNFFSDMPAEDVEKMRKDVEASLPLGRFGTSEEVAAVTCFLLSDEAGFVTASEYVVDGGNTMH